MLRHKGIDRICAIVIALAVVGTVLFMNGASLDIATADRTMGYENRLFDNSRVHTLDIVMDDWDGFIETCANEEYAVCSVIIDGETQKNVAIRAKGNTSLSSVAAYGNNRYSFKIEFDQYNPGSSYHGLDKLSLNNLIQDNSCLKDYISYTMMRETGVASPLCSFVNITVNGEAWGLYLAVEGVEESFLKRNYGADAGELYKPDSLSMDANRGNGMNFNMDGFKSQFQQQDDSQIPNGMPQMPENFAPSAFTGQMPEGMERGAFSPPSGMDEGFSPPGGGSGGGFGGMGSADVMLQYVDDDPASYANIFDNAKTKITEDDKARLIGSLKTLSEGGDIESVVDVDAVIRYLVVHNFLCNDDSYTGNMVHNYYLYEDDGVLSMIPWDYNLAFGGFEMGGFGRGGASTNSDAGATSSVNSPIDSPVSSGDISARPMISWIFASETYTDLYHEYYAEFVQKYFDSGELAATLDSVVALISPYVKKDPTAFCTYEEYAKAIDTLQKFCDLRGESIAGQLDGTIPSTKEGQSADASKLVDASSISTRDIGSFAGGMGGGRMPSMVGGFPQARDDDFTGFNQENNAQENMGTDATPSASAAQASSAKVQEIPADLDATATANPSPAPSDTLLSPETSGIPEASTGTAGNQHTTDPSQFRSFGGPGGSPFSEDATGSNVSGESAILLIVSVMVLLAGLAFAIFYKRR